MSSQMSRGSGLSKDGLGDLKRAVEAVEAAGMKNGTSASKPSAGNLSILAFNQTKNRYRPPALFSDILMNCSIMWK